MKSPLLLTLPLLAVITSCSLQEGDPPVPSDVKIPMLKGKVTGHTGKGRTYAVLYDLSARPPRPMVDQLVGRARTFEFPSPVRGEYGVAAFEDLNGNYRQDIGEPAGYTRFPAISPGPKGQAPVIASRHIYLRPRHKRIANPVVLSPQAAKKLARMDREEAKAAPPEKKASAAQAAPPQPRHPASGSIVSLNDGRFSSSAAEYGYANPKEFLSRHGMGLYLTDAYVSRKRPVVFVHGIGSSASEWRSLVGRLDGGRIQPLIFHYPTGMPIEDAAVTLTNALRGLQKRYRFTQVDFVGQGSGGLVANSAARQFGGGKGPRRLVTLGTPWNGVSVTSSQVRRSHASWDIRSGSASLRAARQGSSTQHHLLFAYQNPQTLATQLYGPVQDHASRVAGFNTTEKGLLKDAKAATYVGQALR